MISSLAWIPKGAAAKEPTFANVPIEEVEEMTKGEMVEVRLSDELLNIDRRDSGMHETCMSMALMIQTFTSISNAFLYAGRRRV